MQQEPQEDHEQGEKLENLSLYPARDFNRWATLINALRTIAATTKRNMQIQAMKVAEANPSERQELLEELLEIAGTDDLAEAEAFLLLKGVQSISLDDIATTTNGSYLFLMGLVLEAGEVAVQRLQAVMEEYRSQRLSKAGQDGAGPEMAKPSNEPSAKAAGAPSLKDES